MTAPHILKALARCEVRALPNYNAGLSSETVRQRYGLTRIAKLGSNENPLGAAPAVAAAIASAGADCAIYCDPQCAELRSALAIELNVDPAYLVFGNGSEDLLGILARTFLDHGDEVVTVLPAFGLHLIYPQAVGAEVRGVPLLADGSFDVDGMITALGPRTRLLMFSCPSNPVGSILFTAELQRLLDALPEHTLLVFDEAYFEYAQVEAEYPDCLALLQASGKPFVLLRTFSKAYALAGLRVGYGITSDPLLSELIDRMRTPFNVNRVAQAAAVAALADNQHLQRGLELVASERRRMCAALHEMGLKVAPSWTNFLVFETSHEAEVVNERLLQFGVIVKPWRDAGYTGYLRVSVGSTEDNDMFLEALCRTLAELA